MKISASVTNGNDKHRVVLRTGASEHSVTIPPKASGKGSSANGGELLFLAFATCYCNDIYREAAKRAISVTNVEVNVQGEFGAEGDPAKNVTYGAKVTAHAGESDIQDLMKYVDTVAEIQNTVRRSVPVTLTRIEAIGEQKDRHE